LKVNTLDKLRNPLVVVFFVLVEAEDVDQGRDRRTGLLTVAAILSEGEAGFCGCLTREQGGKKTRERISKACSVAVRIDGPRRGEGRTV
jgi:hypothetical protein